jgi:prepilin peptidase CpaA
MNLDATWSLDALLVASAVLAVRGDLLERRIYNWVTYPTFGLALVLQLALYGWQGPLDPGLFGALCGALALGLPHIGVALLGWLGEGDAKLMTAYGALFGLPQAVGMLLAVSAVGLVQGLAAVLARTRPGRWFMARCGMTGTDDPAFARELPYGLSIAAGALLFRLWQRWPELAGG